MKQGVCITSSSLDVISLSPSSTLHMIPTRTSKSAVHSVSMLSSLSPPRFAQGGGVLVLRSIIALKRRRALPGVPSLDLSCAKRQSKVAVHVHPGCIADHSRVAMLLLAAWSASGWLPSGHAMRMALDLSLHKALEKLAETSPVRARSQEEERDLVVSSRIWLCLYCFDHQCV